MAGIVMDDDNMAFGVNLRKVSKEEIDRRVSWLHVFDSETGLGIYEDAA